MWQAQHNQTMKMLFLAMSRKPGKLCVSRNSADQFVSKLGAYAGGVLSASEKSNLISLLNGNPISESRNPFDPPDAAFAGYNVWLGKLNQFNGNFINAEWQRRFFNRQSVDNAPNRDEVDCLNYH